LGGALNIVKIITDKGLVLSYTYASHQHHPWSAAACPKKERGLHIWSAAGKRGEERRGEERNPWLAHCTRYLGNNS